MYIYPQYHNIIQLLCTTRNAKTVVAMISWRGNAEIVHTQWHNSFKTAPTHRVATDILRFVAVRYSPDTGPPRPLERFTSWPSILPMVDTGVVGTYPDLTGRSRVISRTGYMRSSRIPICVTRHSAFLFF